MLLRHYLKVFRGSPLGILTILGVLLLMPAAPGMANDVSVGCAGGAAVSDYATIGDALNALHAISFRDHHISVSGTCSELVGITDFTNLFLEGSPSATIVAPGGQAPPILSIYQANDIWVKGFTFQGSGREQVDLVRVFSSRVTFEECTIQGSAASGLFVNDSNVWIRSSQVQDNLGLGIRAANSVFSIGDVNSDPVPSIIQRNGEGIQVDENGLARIYGATIIQENLGAGILVRGARVIMCCEEGQRRILNNNGDGISVNTGSFLAWGPLLIEDNKGSGISLIAASAQVNGDGGSEAIQKNGWCGISGRGNAHLELYSASVADNASCGISMEDNSSTLVWNTTMRGNGLGIGLDSLSSAALAGGNSITGNGKSDLYCSSNSYARGDKSGIGNISCNKFGK